MVARRSLLAALGAIIGAPAAASVPTANMGDAFGLGNQPSAPRSVRATGTELDFWPTASDIAHCAVYSDNRNAFQGYRMDGGYYSYGIAHQRSWSAVFKRHVEVADREARKAEYKELVSWLRSNPHELVAFAIKQGFERYNEPRTHNYDEHGGTLSSEGSMF